MKRILILILIMACIMTSPLRAQSPSPSTTEPTNTNMNANPNTGIKVVRPDNSIGVYGIQQTPQQGATQVQQPAGQLKTTNLFGSQTTQPQGTEPAPTKGYNDYHLTQPGPSPATNVMPSPNSSPTQSVGEQQQQLIKIDQADLPNTMIDALSDPRYSGWETSTFYRDPKTNEYLMDYSSGEVIRRFRFDQRGYPVETNDDDND